MMNKALFFSVFLLFAVSSFAQNIQNRYLFIEGRADRADHLEFFKANFSMEADSSGYIVTKSKGAAAHTFKFNVAAAGQDADQYVIKISLSRNDGDFELVAFDFFFKSLEEMYLYNRTLFLNAVGNIPLPLLTEENLVPARENNNAPEPNKARENNNAQDPNKQWDKWIYFRASFDFPITFYLLQSTGLKGRIGLFNINPPRVSPIGHEVMAMPGATLGAELQLLNYLSLEFNLQLSMGDTRSNYFVNMTGGLELKFPIKFKNIMLVPYEAFAYHFNVSPVFSDFPRFALGAGVQLCARAGMRGTLFVDIKYMFSFRDAVMHNPYLAFPAEQQLFPEPPVIHYKRSYLGIGIGYKIGILDRK